MLMDMINILLLKIYSILRNFTLTKSVKYCLEYLDSLILYKAITQRLQITYTRILKEMYIL